jgi:CDP-diacylglycerol--glycerol-3-phosphate 3-phosphatidyltransferase
MRRRQKRDERRRRRSLREPSVLLQEFWNLPNMLTLGRILLIPLFVWFTYNADPLYSFCAAALFTLAAVTDVVDGYLARRWNLVTVVGKFMDPLADKLIVMASLIWLVPMARISAWVVVVLLSREISVTGLRSIAASEGVVISAGQEGKVKTALQMIGIVALLLGYPYHLSYLGIDLGVVDVVHVGKMLIYLSLVFSLASAVEYVRLFGAAVEAKDLKRKERASTRDLSA